MPDPVAEGATSERYYTTNLGSRYVLPADQPELARLQLQYDLLKRHFPVLPKGLEFTAGDEILDSGTGTGIWTLDAYTLLPAGVSMTAIDVESRLFPPTDAIPHNVSFLVCSVLDLPADWTARFRFVAQRMLRPALGAKDWGKALSELYRVTKPGGMIQLLEAGEPVVLPGTAMTADNLPYTHRFWTIVEQLFRLRDLLLDCETQIPAFVTDAGFGNVEAAKVVIPVGPGEEFEQERRAWLGTFQGMKGPLLKLGGLGVVSGEDDLDELMRGMTEEWATKPVGVEYTMFTARKE